MLAKYMRCLFSRDYKQLYSHMKQNKSFERPRLADTHQPSVIKGVFWRDIRIEPNWIMLLPVLTCHCVSLLFVLYKRPDDGLVN